MPRFTLVTFGCQMNQHDSERIGEVLRGAGYSEASGVDDADLVLLNTCSVREKAEQKLRSEVGRLARLKRARPALVLAVAGCVAQQEGDRLLRSMPSVDLILGPDNIAELPSLLAELETGAPPIVRARFDVDEPRFLRAGPVREAATTAFVTIMKGCDERCSFCIVPFTRGPERYRPSPEIVEEIARLVDAGVREVTLLGQTVNSYTDPLGLVPEEGGDDESQFAGLLRAIAERVPGLLRLRYTSPHPRHLTRSLIRAHRELDVLARHVHLPVQSGSDRVLKRMIRRYSVAEYCERVLALRAAVPEITLSTDVIVGFPRETEEDFALTLELVERIGFTGLFGFKYSRRPYTPALKLGDDVSEADKRTRLAQLFRVSDALRRAHLETLVGTTQEVLVESASGQARFSGRCEHNEIAHFASEVDLRGRLVALRITRAFKNSLEGEPLDVAPAVAAQARSAGRRALPVVTATNALPS